MAGNFYESARNVGVEGGVLFAELRTVDGEWVPAHIDLNEFIGNDDGQFVWEEPNFSETAGEVEFNFEGDDNVPILRAQLRTREGNWVQADINLGERLINSNGQFEFQFVSCTYLYILRPNY
ncbi:Cyanovirin-N [Aspergillus minisclerotigenes]|uniref:Cyanovirin-N n=1 Tax=Aspergillus minisclerotigenes TaxID=656917 RepID=A0A5N6J650_9EURO|nr:Cyanovirin-N [Aspergillus minisclerotigenes]